MIRDLADTSPSETTVADVVVVGAGIAGLVVAVRLAARGLRVVVLESGSLQQKEDTHPLNATEQIGQYYKGSDVGRFRCLGGTSTRWGGALIPFLNQDFGLHPRGWDADWLDLEAELLPYLETAETLFGLPRSSYAAADVPALPIDGAPCFAPRLAKWPAFSKRNVGHLFNGSIKSPDGPAIWLNATVTSFRFRPDGQLAGLQARSKAGGLINVEAPQFVLCAGAIESTRLLLLADRAANDQIFAPHDVLGRYFHDHIADTVGQFTEIAPGGLNLYSGFRFEAKGMRNLRFEPTEHLRRTWNMPAAFAHISFASTSETPFDGLRQVLRAIQRRELPKSDTLGLLMGSTGWLMRAAWWRLVRKRLLYPDNVQLAIDLVIEQMPQRDSRIDLSRHVDAFGLPLARIDWRVSSVDQDNMMQLADLFARAWSGSSLANVATLKLLDDTQRFGKPLLSGGVYHPGGSTRLGKTAHQGVLDREFRTFGLPNLTVVATSAFPTGGSANPTMMLILAALRASDRLATALVR